MLTGCRGQLILSLSDWQMIEQREDVIRRWQRQKKS